ncbi:nucleolar pre-ribosomal-associated protein 1 isoform X2 [Ptiloglossa arizonensis]|uniref:nucleolar pre-ribosomal-associated protein 1 isoform X2 n=1 Tax=Ptiloglossa arizonensis TaxID=3350558 RepID=UPI003F9FEE31
MKINLTDDESYQIQNDIKEKRNRKVEVREEGTSNINDNVKVNLIPKRNLLCKENGIIKKWKKRRKTDSFINDVSNSECIKELGKEVFEQYQGSIEMKNLKSLRNVECNNKTEVDLEDNKSMNVQAEELDGKSLRTGFNSVNGLDMLRKFVNTCNNNKERDLAAEYLNSGGNILEVLKLLETVDKKNIGAVTTVFSAVRILLIKILAQYPQYQFSAEGACRHVINSHLSSIHSMLSVQSNTKQRKVVLQLLAAIVSLGGYLPHELLTHLSLLPEVIKSLVRHTKPTDNQNIRNCYIHFILAFLIEGNALTIKILLDKHNLFSSIFPDLIYDSKDIIALVITTLKTYILKNSKISKTMKLHIFSTSVIQNLISLYNWKGPSNWSKNKIQSFTENPQYHEEKEVVNEIVHDFLIILLTSHRYGVVFHDYTFGTSHIKRNQLVNTILQSLDRPWEHEKPSNLLIKIMAACPDLIKTQFILLEPHILPRISSKWLAVMKFVRKIIESVDIETNMKMYSMELSVSQLATAIMSLTLPGIILKHAVISSLTHSNIIVRHEAVLTLTTMFEQIRKYLLIAKEYYESDIHFCTFENNVLQSTIKNVPNLNMILKLWNWVSNSTDNDSVNKEYISEPKKYEHLTAILNLLYMYNDTCPKLLHTLTDLQPNTFLNTLNELDNVDIAEFNAIKIKAIQFLVILNPTEFSPQKKIFSDVLSFLIFLLNKEVSTISLCIKITIKILLKTTGLFEGCSDQLDIWMNGFINLNEKQEVINWFINIVKKAAKDIERYANEIIETEEIVSEEIVQTGRLEDIFNELVDMDIMHENLERDILRIQRFTSISPLLCCMLHKVKKNLHSAILDYASYILVHTLHYQVAPQCLIHLTKDIPELPVQKYLLSWLENSNPVCIKNVPSSMVLIFKLNLVLLSDTKIQINEIFIGNNKVTFKYNNEDITIYHSLSKYEITCLFRMTIFYLTQFTKRGVLTTTQVENYKILLISLLYLAKESPDNSTFVEECVQSLFTHPIILYYFSPFHQKSKDIMKSMITYTIIDICNVIIHWYKKWNFRKLISHFKNKLLIQLHKMIDKHQRSDKINNVEMIITLLNLVQVTSQEVVYLLKKLVTLESTMFISKDEINLSMYGYIIPKLLEIISNDEIKSERDASFELDAEFVKCLCSHLLVLKSKGIINFGKWESTLHEYVSKFPFNIAGINTDIFLSLLSTTITDTTVRLLSFLISKNMKFIPIFTEYMLKSENIKESNIVFPIIASNLNFKWNQEFLQKLKTYYEVDILSYLGSPKNTKGWIEKNVTAVSYLIKHVFDFKTCSETCKITLEIGDKLDMVSIQYIQILECVYNKYAILKKENEKECITNLIQVLLHIITLTLKKESKNVKKLSILCDKLNDAVKYLKDKEGNFLFVPLDTNHSWFQFIRFSMKFGFKELKHNKQPLPILKTLSTLCDITYKNDSDSEYVKTLFEMATSHSEFLNIMLESSDAKRDLVELLWILIQKNKTVMVLTHVPVYLAAYNATLNATDQYLLLILQYYESNNINIDEYRPYLWGNAAAVYYSVKGETHMNLWREPSTSQVLNLFEESIINNTIKNYPMNRALKNIELHRTSDTYDPAFYLPLLYFLLSENNVISCHKIAQSGALALAFAACSSNHSDVRMLAYTLIARYYTHLEASSSKAKLLWMRLIDALRYGIISLQSELNNIRLNCIVSIFLARTSLIATQPLHPLYSPLQIFLMAKPALDINSIPELLQLFHSSYVEHKVHRHWILENIRDGMKTENELDIAFKCVLFKMLLGFYTCNLSDPNTKILILEIINVTLKITKASVLLIEGHGLFPWLLEVTNNLRSYETQYIEFIVKIMDKLLSTVLKIKGDTDHYKLMLLNIALSLKLYLYKDIKITVFTLYINILQKLLLSKYMKMVVTKECVMEILEFSKNYLGNMDECDNMLRFGCEYITKADCFENDNEIKVARNCLRTMVWTWCSHEVT